MIKPQRLVVFGRIIHREMHVNGHHRLSYARQMSER